MECDIWGIFGVYSKCQTEEKVQIDILCSGQGGDWEWGNGWTVIGVLGTEQLITEELQGGLFRKSKNVSNNFMRFYSCYSFMSRIHVCYIWIYMVTWIPSKYTPVMLAYIQKTMDPMGIASNKWPDDLMGCLGNSQDSMKFMKDDCSGLRALGLHITHVYYYIMYMLPSGYLT